MSAGEPELVEPPHASSGADALIRTIGAALGAQMAAAIVTGRGARPGPRPPGERFHGGLRAGGGGFSCRGVGRDAPPFSAARAGRAACLTTRAP